MQIFLYLPTEKYNLDISDGFLAKPKNSFNTILVNNYD